MEELIKYHYEQIIELLSEKKLDNKEKKMNIKMGTGRVGANINKTGFYMAKTTQYNNITTTFGEGVIGLPVAGIHVNKEAILEAVSEKLSQRKYNEEFSKYLSSLINEKGKTTIEVLLDSKLDENCFDKILTGEALPEKEDIFKIGFALELNITEVFHLLARAGYSLKPNSINEDYIIMYGVDNHLSMDETDQLIGQYLLE